jgi:hypothetical protein
MENIFRRLKETGLEGADRIHLAQGTDWSMAGSCEHDNELTNSMNAGEFLH